MTGNDMISLMNRKPFETIEIHLDNGARIRVEHPWQIATRPEAGGCIVYDDESQMHIISFRNVSEIITAAPPVN